MDKPDDKGLSRRELLQRGALLAGSTALPASLLTGCPSGFPFTLGVASGDPTANGVVLWTRLALDPLIPGGGMPNRTQNVFWEVALDPAMTQVIQTGRVPTTPEMGFSVHVEVSGLPSDTWLWYRFRARGFASRIGRTRTFPAAGVLPSQMRFGLVSCQNFGSGFYSVYHNLAQEDLDFVVHAGDYIYEINFGNTRPVPFSDPVSLEDYRIRYALYKMDPQLQDAHARFPFIHTWDDHEVANDYTGDFDENGNTGTAFLDRRAAAYQAHFEHLPLSSSTAAQGFGSQLNRTLDFGDLGRVVTLDTRRWRSTQPCPVPFQTFGPLCTASQDPARTILGFPQEAWLENQLAASPAVWNVALQSQMVMDLMLLTPQFEQIVQLKSWAGTPRARLQFLNAFLAGGARNPIVLSGDFHSAWVADLKPESFNPASPIVGTEFVSPPVSSFPATGLQAALDFIDQTHPHVNFREINENGYFVFSADDQVLRADLRVVDDVLSPTAAVSTLATFEVQDGVPGATQL